MFSTANNYLMEPPLVVPFYQLIFLSSSHNTTVNFKPQTNISLCVDCFPNCGQFVQPHGLFVGTKIKRADKRNTILPRIS